METLVVRRKIMLSVVSAILLVAGFGVKEMSVKKYQIESVGPIG